jgi:hypothetical protein
VAVALAILVVAAIVLFLYLGFAAVVFLSADRAPELPAPVLGPADELPVDLDLTPGGGIEIAVATGDLGPIELSARRRFGMIAVAAEPADLGAAILSERRCRELAERDVDVLEYAGGRLLLRKARFAPDEVPALRALALEIATAAIAVIRVRSP